MNISSEFSDCCLPAKVLIQPFQQLDDRQATANTDHLHIDVRSTPDTDAEEDELIITCRSHLRLLADKVEESDPAE